MTLTVLKTFFQKQAPITIKYRDYKSFDKPKFQMELDDKLNDFDKNDINYNSFETIFTKLLNEHAPIKEKYVRANNAPFMTKSLTKAIMNRSRLKNKFIKNPDSNNRSIYNKHRNFCVNLLRKEKKKYYNNLDLKLITDNTKFWKTIKPLFSDKNNICRKITLIEKNEIISNDKEVAEVMNDFFSNAVANLDITGYQNCIHSNTDNDIIGNIITKFKHHPSILKIKDNIVIQDAFCFTMSNDAVVIKEIHKLNINKPTPFNNISAKNLVENIDICSPFITKFYNDSLSESNFPDLLKQADITPAHKKDDRTNKENYRPISILPAISKIFERIIYEQISAYMNNYLSDYLCGFRKSYNTQQCLLSMLEKWRKALDKSNVAGALLTDLSKAFDCLNHELLIAKLEAYGFDYPSLAYILSYLTGRKQRTKVNNSFSKWADIKSGIPQGSILGPLLFNIYLNDIFYFVKESNLTNYADDNTPYATETTVNSILNSIQNDTLILINWFNDNYFKMNVDKCHLLVTNHEKDVFANIDGHKIHGSKSVKLLGIHIDNKLDFSEHVSNICKKVGKKLHALRRVSHLMHKDKLRLLMKAFIESQFGYCPLIWMFHNRTLNNRINMLHEKALRLVYNDYNLSFNELLVLDNSFTIHHRNLQKLATEMFKVKNNLSPTFMKNIFPESKNPYNLRYTPEFQTKNIRTVFNGTETISFRGPQTWALVPSEIKMSTSLLQFKEKIKRWKPEGCMCRLCKIYVKDLGFI